MSLEPLGLLLATCIFWAILYAMSRSLPLKKCGLEVHPAYLVYKTRRFNDFLSNVAKKRPQFWRVIWNIGVGAAVGQMIFAGYLLANNLFRFIFAPQEAERVFLLIPGITVRLIWFPYLLIAISLAMIAHEAAHGVAACVEEIPIKSAGILLAFITFIGFVEPDEEHFKKARLPSKLRLLSAGSLTNLAVGLLTLLLVISIYLPPSGVLVVVVNEDGPAYRAGVRRWDVIYAINGTDVDSVADMNDFMLKVKPGDTLIFGTSNGDRTVKAETNLGIEVSDHRPLRFGGLSPPSCYHLYLTLDWLLIISLNLAIFNMMPLYPMDGDGFISSLLEGQIKRGEKGVRVALNAASLALIVANVGLSFMKYGLAPI